MTRSRSRTALRETAPRAARVLRFALLLALVALCSMPPAGAGAQLSAGESEFTLDTTRGLVGSFDGFGGQLNQHLYAKISGPPPNIGMAEAKVIALDPQFVRIFFNTSAWTNPDRLTSFERTVRLAHRAGSAINITWQGSTFAFAMNNMDRFSDELASLLEDDSIDHLWVTLFNEPNTTERTPPEYERVYRLLDRELRAREVRGRVRFMGGDLIRSTTGPSQAEWFRYMASNMGDLLDAWSVHVYWDFWDPGKIDVRLLDEVRAIFSAIPEQQRRPLYITEFGIRGVATFEGEDSYQPGFWPDGTPMAATNAAAFQQAWFNIRATQLGYSGTVRWDVYPAKYDAGTQDHSTLGAAAAGWPERPSYRALRLMTVTTEPRGGSIVDMVRAPGADGSKLLTAYISPAKNITILGLDTDGGLVATTSNTPVSYSVGGLPPNTFFRLIVWNGNGTGVNVDKGFFATTAQGTLEFTAPLDSVFALTNTPIMTVPR